MRPLGTVWTEMRHHDRRARELGEVRARGEIVWLTSFFEGIAAEAASHDRKAAAWSRVQVAIGEFVLAIGGT